VNRQRYKANSTGKMFYVLLISIALLLTNSFRESRRAASGSSASGAEQAQQNATAKVRCIALECYVSLSDESTKAEFEQIRALVAARRGVKLKIHDIDAGERERERLQQIEAAYKISARKLPVVYGMDRLLSGPLTPEQWKSELTKLLTMQVYVRQGCSKCAKAKDYLVGFKARYPGIEVQYMDVVNDATANLSYNELVRSQRIGGISFPGFWFCRQLVVGFDSANSTGGRLEGILRKWTFECELPNVAKVGNREAVVGQSAAMLRWVVHPAGNLAAVLWTQPPEEQPPLEIGDSQNDLPLPIDVAEADRDPKETPNNEPDEIDVPFLGPMSASRMGMPAFTLMIGLVDGFNPCAMWVLLFLLSVLVNLRVRWKIFAVAGTFVLVSGLAYFAFMAAWLNVLLFVGLLRWVQILLALLAIFVGSVHVKDFFAFKRGISLSIPESAKPGIYARVRSIVMAEHIWGAITGAFVLAVLVNLIELLCTAGLPALYSQVLMMQDYPTWKNYAYLSLYIVAYMFDDSVMVGIVILTLGKRKLQENEGRWLKLLSGLVILALGILLLLKPDWLM
jgi:glutaredoxin